jgi:hypothetical protein
VGVRTRVLGPEHPDTINARLLLYSLMWMQGNTLEACQLFEGCVAKATRVLGAEHPVVKCAEAWLSDMQQCTAQGGEGAGCWAPVRNLALLSSKRCVLPLLAAAVVALVLRGIRPHRRISGQA